MKKIIIFSVLLATIALTFISAPVTKTTAAVVHSNRDCFGAIEDLSIGDGAIQAHGFTTDNASYIINSITVLITAEGSDLVVRLHADDGGTPGAMITTLGTIPAFTGNVAEATFTGLTPYVLSPNTTYWLAFATTDGSVADISDDDDGCFAATGLWTTVGYFEISPESGFNGYNLMIEIDASPVVGSLISGDYGKIGQVRVTAPGSALYESAAGNVVRDDNGQEIWVPNPTADNPNEDTYDVLSQVDIDGTTWVEIFLGNSLAPVWLPVGGSVSPIY